MNLDEVDEILTIQLNNLAAWAHKELCSRKAKAVLSRCYFFNSREWSAKEILRIGVVHTEKSMYYNSVYMIWIEILLREYGNFSSKKLLSFDSSGNLCVYYCQCGNRGYTTVDFKGAMHEFSVFLKSVHFFKVMDIRECVKKTQKRILNQ